MVKGGGEEGGGGIRRIYVGGDDGGIYICIYWSILQSIHAPSNNQASPRYSSISSPAPAMIIAAARQ